MRSILELFFTFFKIGLFTFGGGYAMISLIEDACVVKKKWITHEEMMNITVIAESTPGPIVVNCATYVGLKKKGFWGAVAATFGVVLPSFILILLISFFLDSFLEIKWVASAFRGIKAAVGVLIVGAAVKMISKMNKRPLPLIILSASFIAMMCINIFALSVSTVVLMLIAATVGIAVYLISRRSGKGDSNDAP